MMEANICKAEMEIKMKCNYIRKVKSRKREKRRSNVK